jgi:hypothetical protein
LVGILIFLIFLAGVITGVVKWSRKKFSVLVFLIFFALLLIVGVINLFNEWPSIIAQFSTAEPLSNQIFTMVAPNVVGILFISAVSALVIGFITSWMRGQSQPRGSMIYIGAGWGLGLLIAGLSSVVSALFKPSLEPLWADLSALSYYIPLLRDGLHPISGYILGTTLILLIITAIDNFTRGWAQKRIIFAILIVLMGFVVAGDSIESITFYIISGLISGIIYLLAYIFVFRYNLCLIPLAIGAGVMVDILRQGIMNAYPYAIPGAVLAVVAIGCVSVYWYKLLSR